MGGVFTVNEHLLPACPPVSIIFLLVTKYLAFFNFVPTGLLDCHREAREPQSPATAERVPVCITQLGDGVVLQPVRI